MEKICFIVQRYGKEVNGGAEQHCRQLAEHLISYYDVTVLTTKAISYITWENEYKQDEETLNGVQVLRFPVVKPRDMGVFNKINKAFANGNIRTKEDEMEWLLQQGPETPDLLDYLRKYKNDYKAFIFFTYLYYPTVMGLPIVQEKAILIPTAHREPFLEMEIYKQIFRNVKALFYNTCEERFLSEFVFQNEEVPNDIGGVGIEHPAEMQPQMFKEKYKLDQYILYVGRIDEAKGCKRLFEYFEKYRSCCNYNLKLVLMGKAVMDIPDHQDILSLGFVDDKEKFNGMAGAVCLVIPSEFESLSMVALESLSVGRPILVNGRCDVLVGHCSRGNAGLYYHSYDEFAGALNYLLKNEVITRKMGSLGQGYVQENYCWDIIVHRLIRLIDYVGGE